MNLPCVCIICMVSACMHVICKHYNSSGANVVGYADLLGKEMHRQLGRRGYAGNTKEGD